MATVLNNTFKLSGNSCRPAYLKISNASLASYVVHIKWYYYVSFFKRNGKGKGKVAPVLFLIKHHAMKA
jgi:hypothetical protein